MKDISNREDVKLLVNTFYDKVRKDKMIGNIFNSIIGSEESWVIHLEKLTDFWETNLFSVSKYKGNPIQIHQNVDFEMGYSITQAHFDRWIELWIETNKALFEGAKTKKAISNAKNIAQFMFIKMYSIRQ